MKKHQLLFKAITLITLIVVMLIPIYLVDSTIKDRQYYQQEAIYSVGNSYSKMQTVVGPIMVIPVKEKEKVWQEAKEEEKRRRGEEEKRRRGKRKGSG